MIAINSTPVNQLKMPGVNSDVFNMHAIKMRSAARNIPSNMERHAVQRESEDNTHALTPITESQPQITRAVRGVKTQGQMLISMAG